MVGVAAIVVVGAMVLSGCSNGSVKVIVEEKTSDSARTAVDWDSFTANSQEKIDDATEAKDCRTLQNQHELAYFGSSADHAIGGSDLLAYIREAIKIAGCGIPMTIVKWDLFADDSAIGKSDVDKAMKEKDCPALLKMKPIFESWVSEDWMKKDWSMEGKGLLDYLKQASYVAGCEIPRAMVDWDFFAADSAKDSMGKAEIDKMMKAQDCRGLNGATGVLNGWVKGKLDARESTLLKYLEEAYLFSGCPA